jgi:hypothetical protein
MSAPAKLLDPDLVQVIRRFGVRRLMEGLRDYAYSEAQDCQRDGLTGLGWLELYDVMEENIPASDDALCGDEAPEVVTCRSCLTGGDYCTC